MLSVSVKLRRLRFWWRLFWAYIKKYQLRFAATLIVILALGLSTFKIWQVISRGNLISIGYVGSYTIENIPTEILGLVTQPLISANERGEPVPLLASHWTVSEDTKTYVVFLKDNLSWHDSTPVDAANISLAISNVQITALNNKAIEFKLPNPRFHHTLRHDTKPNVLLQNACGLL